ncbi:MAG: hypothetical protein JW971_09755 [Synergistales bacterium]|nr:hypothetical protein [Synergistales bacterium]
MAVRKILFSVTLIIAGLALGYILQILVNKRFPSRRKELDLFRIGLQKGVLLVIIPITILGALWILRIDDIRVIALPGVGALHYILGGIMAIFAARIMGLGKKETGSLFCCGFFTNIGSMGGLITYLLLGEEGYALVPVYKLFAEILYYTLGFPLAKFFSNESGEKEPFGQIITRVLKDKFLRVALLAIVIGGVLNFSGLQRPLCYREVNSLLIPLGTFLMLLAIGMAMKFSSIRAFLREAGAICIIKFALVPILLVGCASFLGFGGIREGLLLKVVVILSFMPSAFVSLIPPSIYDLDLDLANTCWLVTTFAMVLVIPALFYILPYLD